MKRPNFFIAGAPKCGTTALSNYLGDLDDVYVTSPKEPHFFATDLPGYRITKTIDEYDSLFDRVTTESAIGEASVFYMLSDDAIPGIAKFNPDARIIVMLRNPVDLVHSFHAQMLFSHDENMSDFAEAWRLCASRRCGENIPDRCRDPKLLQYDRLARLGEQLQRVYQYFPKEKVLVIFFEDFVADIEAEYRRAVNFLGFQESGRTEFPRINESRRHRSRILADLLFNKTRALRRPVQKIKAALGIKEIGLLKRLRKMETKHQVRKPLDPELRKEIRDNYIDDIYLLEKLVDRKMDKWYR